MNFVKRLNENKFHLTDYNKPTLVDAMRAIYNTCGKDFKESDATKEIKSKLNNSKHILFILSDGMGSNLINKLPDDSILKANNLMDLQTVNPSTTGCAIPSVLTGEYPATHGMLGWFSFNRERNLGYLPVLFMERDSGKSLKEFGVNEEDIYKTPSAVNLLNRKSFALFPSYMVDSPFSSFACKTRIGYTDISDAFKKYTDEILSYDGETYTYMYLPHVDSREHEFGVYTEEVNETVKTIEREVENIKAQTKEDLEIIITADHGLTDVNYEPIRMDFEKYEKYFYAWPGIDAGTATYYVKEEMKEAFEKEFLADYDGKMFLHPTEELIENNVFGNEPLSDYMKSNLGEYVSFCSHGMFFANCVIEDPEMLALKGTHSGFSLDEVMVPFIVIK